MPHVRACDVEIWHEIGGSGPGLLYIGGTGGGLRRPTNFLNQDPTANARMVEFLAE